MRCQAIDPTPSRLFLPRLNWDDASALERGCGRPQSAPMSETKISVFDRRGFMQAATIAGLTSMAPAPAIRADTSETDSNVTVQPNPSFPEDLNASDILVETLIDWGAPMSSVLLVTASIQLSRLCGNAGTVSAMSAFATRRRPPSWHAALPSIRDVSGCALARRARAPSI